VKSENSGQANATLISSTNEGLARAVRNKPESAPGKRAHGQDIKPKAAGETRSAVTSRRRKEGTSTNG
jgi:hypothetical protein